MDHREIVQMLMSDFYENFARKVGDKIIESDSTANLIDIATSDDNIEKLTSENRLTLQQKNKICFRSAYVMEYLFLDGGVDLSEYYDRILNFYLILSNPGACRHFSKMIFNILKDYKIEYELASDICEVALKWAEDNKTKVAVRIWCMEIVFSLKTQVMWVEDVIPDMIEILKKDSTPAMKVALKRWL